MSVYDRKKQNNIKITRTSTYELTTWLCDNYSSWIECPHCRDNYLTFDPGTGQLECDTSCKFTMGVKTFYKHHANNVLTMIGEMSGKSYNEKTRVRIGG